ncbi:hypothetical protein DUI87_16734 [Hirundo rustica rustica]|uniref:Uncharacterized protein n=1 Tax=Hirundo rustica rustica TaxID=333673 RepID=A0A3M0KJB1_HIRRU|nr:hypothetical protein DUI87_16734 [Hirundo rustica rustica]
MGASTCRQRGFRLCWDKAKLRQMGASNRLTQRPVRQQPGSASSWIGPEAWPGLQEQSRSSLGPWTPQQDHGSDFMVLSSFSENKNIIMTIINRDKSLANSKNLQKCVEIKEHNYAVKPVHQTEKDLKEKKKFEKLKPSYDKERKSPWTNYTQVLEFPSSIDSAEGSDTIIRDDMKS